VGTTPRTLVAADLDNDNDLDLAIANFASNSASILLNTLPALQSTNGAADTNSTPLPEKPVQAVQESKVYPNPFKDEINLIIESEQTEEVLVSISDAFGKIVCNAAGTTNQEMSLSNLNHLSSGMYILRARYGDKVKIFKIVKTK
jgi:hypothetical protein